MVICYVLINIILLVMLVIKGKDSNIIERKLNNKHLNALIFIYIIEILLLFLFNLNKGMPTDELLYFAMAKTYSETGHDLQGYTNLIYTVAWGYGTQSIGYLFLVVPLMRVLGCSVLIFRLPMLLLWIMCTFIGIQYIKEKYNINRAFYTLLYVVTCPLLVFAPLNVIDAHFMTPIILLGLVYLDKGIESCKSKYIYISMLFFGFSYYTYALAFPISTLFLVLTAIYLIKTKRCKLKTVVIAGILCLVIAYFAIAGWLNILFGWTLPNIFNYPEEQITRIEDVGISIETIFLKVYGWIILGLTGIYDKWQKNYFYADECLPTYLKITMFIILIGFLIIYRRTKKKQVGVLIIILSLVLMLLEMVVIKGTDIRFDLLGICIALMFSYNVLNMKGWSRRIFILCNTCCYILYLVIFNTTLNVERNKVNIYDLGTNQSLLQSVEYIYNNDITNVNIILSEDICDETNSSINDYVYAASNVIKITDCREEIETLYNTCALLTTFENYHFYIVDELNNLNINNDLEDYKTVKTKIGYNLIMNNLMTDDLQQFKIMSNGVYTLVYTENEYALNMYNTNRYDNLSYLDNLLRW